MYILSLCMYEMYVCKSTRQCTTVHNVVGTHGPPAQADTVDVQENKTQN
jgi:hypothetical protein